MTGATMRDVAAKAGVTPTVVSRVLHNKAQSVRVSEATAERVRQAAKDLGYRRNALPGMFRQQETMMIGVLHGIGFSRPKLNKGPRYFAALMDGIIDGALDSGYAVTLCPKLMGQRPEDAMSDGRFDGLIWYSTYPSGENRKMLEACSVPLALIHTPGSEFQGRFPSVTCDNVQGIGLAVDHLTELGHTKIAFAMEFDHPFSEAEIRCGAFLAEMARRGLKANEDDLIDVRGDHMGVQVYLACGPRHTAVITSDDWIASLFLRHAPIYGVRVPEDFSVVGFDSTDFCNELRPTLTSVSQPLEVMGQSAVNLLVQSIRGETPDPPDMTLRCGLDIRGSTTFKPQELIV